MFPSLDMYVGKEDIKTNTYSLGFTKNSIYTARVNEG